MLPEIKKLIERLPQINAWVFDMDGVIVNLEGLNYSAYKEAVKNNFNIDLKLTDYESFFAGTKTVEAFAKFAESEKIESYDIEKLVTDFRSIKRSNLTMKIDEVVKVRESIKSLFEEIKKIPNTKICLATSTIKEFTDIIIDHFEFRKYFDVILTGEDVEKGKPDPEIYELAIEKLETEQYKTVVVEDALSGIRSAKAAGAFCIGVYAEDWNAGFTDEADLIIKDFDDLIATVHNYRVKNGI